MGIGKYSGEMVDAWRRDGHQVVVVTTPPYYPQWRILDGFSGRRYRQQRSDCGSVEVIRCPLWVPGKVSGLKRILHLASFAISSIPVVLLKAMTVRPDVVMTVEPAAMCMPTSWLAAKIGGAKSWLHVQDFEVDAAFELGILKSTCLRRLVAGTESFLMRRFDRVSSISPNMLLRLLEKGVSENRIRSLPNWVDCDTIRPLWEPLPNDVQVALVNETKASFGIPADKCIAMYAGNVSVKQGLEILVHAAKRGESNSELHFVICGDGAAGEKFRSETRDLPNVTWLPPQPLDRFNELLSCADIHLLPQKSGAADLVMPSKLTGMLASGRPVVAGATDGTQIAELVESFGTVIPPDDGDAFYDAIVLLSQDAQRCRHLGRAARTYALDHLSRNAILGQLQTDLHEVIGYRESIPIGHETKQQ